MTTYLHLRREGMSYLIKLVIDVVVYRWSCVDRLLTELYFDTDEMSEVPEWHSYRYVADDVMRHHDIWRRHIAASWWQHVVSSYDSTHRGNMTYVVVVDICDLGLILTRIRIGNLKEVLYLVVVCGLRWRVCKIIVVDVCIPGWSVNTCQNDMTCHRCERAGDSHLFLRIIEVLLSRWNLIILTQGNVTF